MSRFLNQDEKQLLSKLLSVEFPGSDILNQQANVVEAETTQDSDNYGSIYLVSIPKSVPAANIKPRVPVEGLTTDVTGEKVNVLLHVVDGYLNELEIVKLDGTPIQGDLDISQMKVVVNS